MSIFEVKHQDRAQRLIQRALATGRLPHALVLCGPEGVGREMFAKRFARLLLCGNRVAVKTTFTGEIGETYLDSCDRCRSCLAAMHEIHPDLHVVRRELKSSHPDSLVRKRKGIDLGVEVIREFLIKHVGTAPTLGRAKVFIVREAERMNSAAQNALLKSLEEPPPTTFLLLLAKSSDDLLPTVRSRCQMIPFGPLPTNFVLERLGLDNGGGSISDEACQLYAECSVGSLGLACRLREDGLFDHFRGMAALMESLPTIEMPGSAKPILDGAKQLADAFKARDTEMSDSEAQRLGIRAQLTLAGVWLRRVLHRLARESDVQSIYDSPPASVLKRWTNRQVADAIAEIAATERRLDSNTNPQLCVESLLIRWSRLCGG